MLYGMLLVAWVDTLRAITCVEVHVELESRYLLNNWYTLVLGDTWINGALVDHNIAL